MRNVLKKDRFRTLSHYFFVPLPLHKSCNTKDVMAYETK